MVSVSPDAEGMSTLSQQWALLHAPAASAKPRVFENVMCSEMQLRHSCPMPLSTL